MKMSLRIASAAVIACAAASAQEIQTGKLLVSDDFDGFSVTDTDIGETWGKAATTRDGEPIEKLARKSDGALWIGYASGKVNMPGVFLRDPQVADGVVELTVGPSTIDRRPHTSIVSYRAPTGLAAGQAKSEGAYHLWLVNDWSGSRDIVLRYGNQRLATANISDQHNPDESFRVRVAFAGAQHRVSVDGDTVINFWDWHTGREHAGYVGFGGYYSAGTFDNFFLYSAVGKMDAPTIDKSRGRIPPLVYQGRPFIPLGTFDRPRELDTDRWLEAGGNSVIMPTFSEELSRLERLRQIREVAAWGAEHDVAIVYFPMIELLSNREDGVRTITRPEEVARKAALLQEMLSVTANHPNTLGYWTFDEPENQLKRAYGQWKERSHLGFVDWLADGLRWTYEVLKEGDPDGYVMPTIAWWTAYEGLAPLYDVNLPNTYAGGDDLYTVVYDCALAADAIRATDSYSFVFMPPCFDSPELPLYSIPEMRYSYLSPFTQGAMGILAWRLNRASEAYRQAVIYPVMREVNRLLPWLHGEWHDDRVTSDHDAPSVDYLQGLHQRTRLLFDDEGGGLRPITGDVVPDVSHCLRRAADNTWLLLAVSNRREPISVTFALEVESLPDSALDMVSWRDTAITNGQISDKMEPFAVRAWRIIPK